MYPDSGGSVSRKDSMSLPTGGKRDQTAQSKVDHQELIISAALRASWDFRLRGLNLAGRSTYEKLTSPWDAFFYAVEHLRWANNQRL